VRRFLKSLGLEKQRRKTAKQTEGTRRAEARLSQREVRGYEAQYVNGLWHWDAHGGSRKVLTPRGELQHPILFGVLDDRSRLACHSGMEGFDQLRDSRVIERARQAIAKSRDLLNQPVPKIIAQSDRATPKSGDQVPNQSTIATEAVPHSSHRYFPSLVRR
jgi:hypothetical protein